MDPKQIALSFNTCINNQDLENLYLLMTDDHTLIDIAGEMMQGKARIRQNWAGFFNEYPDYQNYFDQIEVREDAVYVAGRSTCAYDPLNGPALWRIRVKDDCVAEWQVYEDTPENRAVLGL